MATLVVSQPGWLALAFSVACVAAALLRAAGAVSGRATTFAPLAVVVAGSGAVGALLAAAGGPAAQVLLGGLAIAGGLWMAVELYRLDRAAVRARTRLVLIAARLCAWLVLLTLIARPVCEREVTTWEKPVLALLLDDSASMGISDTSDPAHPGMSRAALANAALVRARSAIDRVDELYDVRLWRVGVRPEPGSAWEIVPAAPLTGLAAALREAREMRSAKGRPPLVVLLISDGAENVADAAAVRQAAGDLASQRTALLAAGVGPEPQQTPLVELEPLVQPQRVGVHDRLHVVAAGRVQGCRGQVLPVEVLWNDEVVASATMRVEHEIQHLESRFDVLPPATGAHRLTVRVALPAALGGQSFATSAVIEVAAEQVRVLYVEQVPTTESAFAVRALRGDATIEVTQHFLFEGVGLPGVARNVADVWTGYDVLVLGRLRPRLPLSALGTLAEAVTERGAGLLLVGGTEMFSSSDYARTPLADISSVQMADRAVAPTGPSRFVPTAAGLRHPALQGTATEGPGPATGPVAGVPPADEAALWAKLPALGEAATLGAPKPAATVLALDESGRPLLAAQEIGRGRCIAAGWDSTWPWALASDAGSALHRRFWRQMVVWLSNRRPRAWVVCDQPRYALAALANGENRVRVRAGITGLPAVPAAGHENLPASLSLRRSEPTGRLAEPVAVKLHKAGEGWAAELPETPQGAAALGEGSYVLEFSVRGPDALIPTSAGAFRGRGTEEGLAASTRFAVVAEDVERRAPTADLSLLRAAAERTSACGGLYCAVTELPQVLGELGRTDHRERVEVRVRYDVADRDPWGLLLLLAVAAGVEWGVRKRGGLA